MYLEIKEEKCVKGYQYLISCLSEVKVRVFRSLGFDKYSGSRLMRSRWNREKLIKINNILLIMRDINFGIFGKHFQISRDQHRLGKKYFIKIEFSFQICFNQKCYQPMCIRSQNRRFKHEPGLKSKEKGWVRGIILWVDKGSTFKKKFLFRFGKFLRGLSQPYFFPNILGEGTFNKRNEEKG